MGKILEFIIKFQGLFASLVVVLPAIYGFLNLFAYRSDLDYRECKLQNEVGKAQTQLDTHLLDLDIKDLETKLATAQLETENTVTKLVQIQDLQDQLFLRKQLRKTYKEWLDGYNTRFAACESIKPFL